MKLKTCYFTLRYASTRIVQQSNNWYMNAEFTVNQLSFATTLFCDEPEINWFVNQALSTHVFHYNYYGKYGSAARNIRKKRGFCDSRENFSYANWMVYSILYKTLNCISIQNQYYCNSIDCSSASGEIQTVQ